MIKKLLNQFINIFSYDYDRKKIENYLAKSNDLTDTLDYILNRNN